MTPSTVIYFKHTMPDVTIFGHMCCGRILLGTNHPVHCIALLEVGVRMSAEFAIVPCTSVLLGSEVEAFHEGPPLGWLAAYATRTALWQVQEKSAKPNGEIKAKHAKLSRWTNRTSAFSVSWLRSLGSAETGSIGGRKAGSCDDLRDSERSSVGRRDPKGDHRVVSSKPLPSPASVDRNRRSVRRCRHEDPISPGHTSEQISVQ